MTHRPIPPLYRELHHRGALPDTVDPVIRAALDADPGPPPGPDDAAVFADDPPEVFARAVQRAAAPARSPAPLRWQVPVGLALAAAVAVFALRPDALPVDSEGVDPDGIRLKGDLPAPALTLLLDLPTGPLQVGPEATLRAGDRVQLAFSAPGTREGVVFSVDGRGVVTEHHRFDRSPGQGTTLVPRSYILDDAPAFEAFHLVVSDQALDVDGVLRAARARGASREPPEVDAPARAVTLVVEKPR